MFVSRLEPHFRWLRAALRFASDVKGKDDDHSAFGFYLCRAFSLSIGSVVNLLRLCLTN
jgi:hypothetical protein